jgi:hypothetical protein
MKDPKEIRRRQLYRAGSTLATFLIINFVLRFALLPINEAEYTDGILQLTQFENQTGVYPPLYTLLTWPFSLLIGQLWAGRLVSATFSALAVIPIFLIAQRSYGARAALFAALVYTVAPAGLRWAPRVMTEAAFSFFFWFSIERLIAARATRNPREADSALMWSGILGAAAALTRYQGIFLVPPVLILAFYLYRRTKVIPWKGLLGLLPYGLIPLWSAATNTIHGGQLAERMGDVPIMTFILNAEPFILLLPFFLTYPVAILATMGIMKGKPRPRATILPITLYVFGFLLVLQSLFGSFQERYFLPLFGLLYVYAGLGMAVADNRLRRFAPRFRPYVPLLVVAFSLFMSFFVLAGSRGAFGDIRRAAEFAASVADESGARILTNEIYRAEREATGRSVSLVPGLVDVQLGISASNQIVANKVAFFARRHVEFLDLEYYEGRIPLQPGDILVMSDLYGRDLQVPALANRYRLEPLAQFSASVIPVFPDMMSIPGTNQNPAAFLYRYTPQNFSTTVFRVEGLRSP